MDSWLTPFARWALDFLGPLVLLWLGLIALTLALWRRRHLRFAAAAGAAVGWITLLCGTPFPVWLVETLERPYAGVKPAAQPAADVIVLLGGGVDPAVHEVGNLHLTIAGDRVVMALELARLAKAPVLCVSGGHAKFGRYRWIEADLVARAIVDRGLTAAEVVSFGGCTDTHDEAMRLRQLAVTRGWRRVLLVTSAVHMRRAAATFRTEGFEVIPAPCNFLTALSEEAKPPIAGLPTPYGFTLFSAWLHEQIGWLEYRRRGWIKE